MNRPISSRAEENQMAVVRVEDSSQASCLDLRISVRSLELFCVHQMNQINSHNDFVNHDDHHLKQYYAYYYYYLYTLVSIRVIVVIITSTFTVCLCCVLFQMQSQVTQEITRATQLLTA